MKGLVIGNRGINKPYHFFSQTLFLTIAHATEDINLSLDL